VLVGQEERRTQGGYTEEFSGAKQKLQRYSREGIGEVAEQDFVKAG